MAYRYEKSPNGNVDLVIDGWEKGIASSPYNGIGNIRNLNTAYMPGVAYVNYQRQPCSMSGETFFAGIHSVNVSGNIGWQFTAPGAGSLMTNPVASATSPAGLNYILDTSGQVWKQSAVNSAVFNLLENGGGRVGNGAGGISFWNNYLVVIGDGLIEFCGNGTGDAGVTAANWNILSSTQTTTQLTPNLWAMYSGGTPTSPNLFHWTSAPLTGATTATLNTAWTGPSGSYPVRFPNAANDVRTCTFTNLGTNVSWTGGLTNDTVSTGFFMYQLAATFATYTGYDTFSAGSLVTFSSSGTLPTGLTAGTQYYLQQTVDLTGLTSTFYVSTGNTGSFQNAVMITSAGTGTITMTLAPSIAPPIKNTTITGFSWGTLGTGSTTITLANAWLGASGIYNIVDPVGNNILATFVYNSSTVTLINPATYQANPNGTFQVNILNPSNTIYKTWNSKVDGNLYFANGRWVGRISLSPNSNLTFNPGIVQSYSVNYAATGTLQDQDTVIDMTDLQGKMIIAGNYDLYPWDYVSSQPGASSPVGEQVSGIINILNNIYILAGQKGNIYVSNGYSSQLLYKIPDYISGVIDPVWSYGGYMFHRGKLYFQASVQNTAGTNILAGVFSMNVSATLVTDIETAGAFVMEAQNSYGLTPSVGSSAVGVLMDNEPSSNGQDSYYSAYSNGSNVGGIDYNSTLLWGSNQPLIETDIIPTGTILETETFGIAEFKLDRPMLSGDSITLNYRNSLSSTYNFIGTTTTAVLSDEYTSNITQSQWLQFEVLYSCSSGTSSFIPLREIRLHIVKKQ